MYDDGAVRRFRYELGLLMRAAGVIGHNSAVVSLPWLEEKGASLAKPMGCRSVYENEYIVQS